MRFKAQQSAARLAGGYYTPPAVADVLARWGLAARPARILEPACGDGAFLAALVRAGLSAETRVEAVEIRPEEAAKAAAVLGGAGRVTAADYLAWAVARDDAFDLVLGNPPYVRSQYLDPAAVEAAQALLARRGLPLPRHLSSWAPFVVDGIARLRPGGRLAMVAPAELLQVRYAAPLRAWLATRGAVTLVRFRRLVFPAVQQEVLLLLLDTAGPPGVRLREVDGLGDLEAPADASPIAGPGGAKWTGLALDPAARAALEEALAHPDVRPLRALAEVCVGVVTGANDFFCADDATVAAWDLWPAALPMFGRSAEVRGLAFTAGDHAHNRAAGRRAWLLDLPARPREDLPAPWRAYLALGEARGLPERYKCRARHPWWAVPSIRAAPLALFKRCHGATRLILNEALAHSTDTAYRVRPRPGVEAGDLAVGFLNSLTLLSVELAGRSYGGGVLELIPSEIRTLSLPTVPAPPGAFADLDRLLRAGAPTEALLDLGDTRVLGDGLGMSPDLRLLLRAGWRALRDRRIGRRG
jgi:adenine-specific DNA methylase